MENVFDRRFLAGIIDSTLIIIAYFFGSIILMYHWNVDYSGGEFFVVMYMLFTPPLFVIWAFKTEEVGFLVIFSVLLLLETIYYTVMEASL